MKNIQNLNLLLILILLAVLGISCKSLTSASSNENYDLKSDSNAGNYNSNASDNSRTIALKTPVPASACPPSVLAVRDLNDSQELEKYAGCTVEIYGKLWDVRAEAVELRDDFNGTETQLLGGNFSSPTYSQIGTKLYDLRTKGYGASQMPNTTFSCVAKIVDGSYIVLKECVMTDFKK